MVIRRLKKVNKYRAHTTHGGGHRKKRRGAGSRGGRGNAGTGKRAGHQKRGPLEGKSGFRPRRTVKTINAVNVAYFTQLKVDALVSVGTATKEGDHYIIDLSKLGFQKLLGTGSTVIKLKITVASHSARAEEKIKAAGGEVSSSVNKPASSAEKSQSAEA